MKNKTFKKSISLIMTVLMIMSCWVFFPGMIPEAEAAASSSTYAKADKYGTAVWDKSNTAWVQFVNGSNKLKITFPREIYLDKLETLESAGYTLGVEYYFGTNSDYRLLLGAPIWGDYLDTGVSSTTYPNVYTMTNVFSGSYAVDSSLPNGGSKEYTGSGTDYDLRVNTRYDSDDDAFNEKDLRHHSYIIYRANSSGNPNTATIYLKGNPTSSYVGKTTKFSTDGVTIASYGMAQQWKGGSWSNRDNGGSTMLDKKWTNSSISEMEWNVTIYDKSALNTSVSTKTLPDSDSVKYTEATWNAYKTARDNAKSVLTTRAVTQSEIKNAKEELDSKYGALQLKTFTVTFNVPTDASPVETKSYKYGYPLDDFVVPTRPGYTFKRWYADNDSNGKYSSGEDVTDANGSIVEAVKDYRIDQNWNVYSDWTEHKYNIAFNANGGTGSTAGISNVLYSADTKLTTNGFSRTGYSFAGWNTKADGTGTAIAEGATVSKLTTADDATVTLYAQWTINKYTVTFIKNDGTTTSAQYDYNTPASSITKPANTTAYNDALGHHTFTWPTVSVVTGDATYTENKNTTSHTYKTTVTAPTCTAQGYTTYTCDCGHTYKDNYVAAKGHTWVDANCTTAKTCSVCGATEGNANGHTPGNTVVENNVAPTCTTAGSYDNVVYCTVCSAEISRDKVTVNALGHTEVVLEAVEATCTATGLTEGKKCSVCQEVLVKQEVTEKKDHEMGEWSQTKAPTCVTAGEKTRKCNNCAHTETEAVSATGVHVYGEWSQFNNGTTHRRVCTADAACIAYEEGSHVFNGTLRQMDTGNYHQYKCEKCEAYGVGTAMNVGDACFGTGTTFEQIDGDASKHKETCLCGREKNDGHLWGSWVADPENKTDENGKMSRICSECYYKQTSDCSYEKTDNYKAPTCTENGYQGWQCKDASCINGYTEILQSPGHDKVTHEAKAPTCTEIGWEAYETCSRCDYSTYTEKPATGHTEGETVVENNVAPDCENAGSYDNVVYCTVCKAELSRDTVTVDSLGHTEVVDEAKAPTCTATGLTEGKHCSVCGEVLVAQKEVAVLGHTEVVDKAVAPTCTATGLTEGKHCSVCGEVLVAQKEVAALGHTEVIDKAVAPDCVNTGLTEGKHCSVCDKVLVAQKEVAALGHTEVVDKAVAPTCTATGFTEGKHCSVCNEVLVKQEVVDALGHSWNTTTYDFAEDGKSCTATRVCKRENCNYSETATATITSAVKTPATCEGKGTTTYTATFTKSWATTQSNDVDDIPALGHKDIDKNHVCDNGCTVYQGEHKDTDKNHICDYGCEELIGDCEDKDYDHDCDYGCNTVHGEHKDTDKNHVCDYGCKVSIGTHEDSSEDNDHLCDYGCKAVLEECTASDWIIETPATCEGKGSKYKECTVCGVKMLREEIAALEHIMQKTADKVEPKCEVPGKEAVYTCANGCGKTTGGEEIAALDHDMQLTAEKVEPKCEVPGKEAVYTCANGCGKTEGGEEIAALDHDMQFTAEKVEPKCEVAGKQAVYTCANNCGKTTGGEEIPALEHIMQKTADKVEPKCEVPGKEAVYTCANGCGKTTGGTVIPALGHDYKSVVTAPTCEAEGYTTYTCTRGDHTYTADKVPAKGHSMKETQAAVKATCIAAGKTAVYTCENGCGKTEGGTVIGILDHSYTGEFKLDYTSDVKTHSQKCVNGCDKYGTATACTFESVKYEPNCASDGYVLHTCSVCKGNYKTDVIPASGHKWSTWEHIDGTNTHKRVCGINSEHTEIVTCVTANRYFAPTCVEDGISEDICTECNYKYNSKKVSAHGHRYIDEEGKENAVIVEPGCTTQGSKYLVCVLCDAKTDPVAFGSPLGHYLYIEKGYAPTCTEDGYTDYKHCLRLGCDYVEYPETLKATGHKDDGEGNCSNCSKPIYDGGSKACNCLCHSTSGFMKFIYKIVLFFWRLFRIQGDCRCGAEHY